MEITFVSKSKSVQPQQLQDPASDPVKNISTEENKKYVLKNKVDSAEISNNFSGSFDDKRIAVAKSAILYDVSVGTNTNHIQELKNAIEKGTYDVPANLIADAMME